jgi:uroporphyrinogen decarboxylase
VQPIRIAPDAAILFSDILVIPQAMGNWSIDENFWSVSTNPIRTIQDVESNRSRCTRNFRLRF